MSIIAEALKKAQDSVEKTTPATSEPRKEKQSIVKSKGRPQKSKTLYFYASGLLAVFILLGGAFFFARQNQAGKAILSEQKLPAAKMEGASLKKESVKRPTYVEKGDSLNENDVSPVVSSAVSIPDVNETIKLNGIMYTPKKPLAVINDSIWVEGDRVAGFMILKIGEDYVRIAYGEKEFVIRLKR